MDVFLGKVTQQAMNYAIRSGVTITASYAIRQSSKLLSSTPKSNVRNELYRLQQKLQHKIHIVSPAIDLIELIAARGNTSLFSAVALVKELRLEIQSLGQRLAKAAEASVQVAGKTRKWSKIIDWLFGSGDVYQKVFIEQHNPLPSYPEVGHGDQL
ncbi:uncharacterized protein Z518_03635 [Rhinocladiella mackenziei CBS 650.93]|uniref:Uncharacterized protein n=1 Tax=Rhinocladiella mackenziei CBS 650.93 TaxID=1442369 RepID=A0A0D2H5H2_9EURO|nr:uncharacterized protein Z518_03635 [Rhinocladiella mackenziei CBS 650.93]KIX05663.1 hypothetical protein Z518_03635 [Rhinocladiella mackenziei CBS 650.93]